MTDFSELNLGIDGDSITAGEQWSFHVYKNLGMSCGKDCYHAGLRRG